MNPSLSDWVSQLADMYFLAECEESHKTCVLSLWGHLANVWLTIFLIVLFMLFLKLGPLQWNILSIGPLHVIAVTRN